MIFGVFQKTCGAKIPLGIYSIRLVDSEKKYPATARDREDWSAFTKQLRNVYDKDAGYKNNNNKANKIRKLDLHGLSLNEANRVVKKFIIESYQDGYKKLLVITGKGLRSKVYENPYLSKEMNVLKNSVPDFIKQNEDLSNKINKIVKADLKDGGEGAFCIFLKKQKNL